MEFLITIIRLPIGIIASLIVIVFWIALFPLEFAIAFICLPFGAIIMSRDALKNTWLGSFPNTIIHLRKGLARIWEWIFND
ncbi:MAG: hypothetical protein K8S16_10285 [Bacteroidales bacterium]|nr:hypothetical protein [Bacteroidales bacterium]